MTVSSVAILFILAALGQKTRALLPSSANSAKSDNVSAIVETCYEYLQSHEMIGEKWNLHFQYYRPSLEKYGPHQWLWDSGAHMIVWAHRNVTKSMADIRTMLQMQQPDGRIPEIIFWGDQSILDIISDDLVWSSDKYVDLTQMPVLPFSLRAIYNYTSDSSFLQEIVPQLVSYFDWWADTRAVDGDDLVYIIHNWESGLDASPAYDPAFGVKNPQPKLFELYPKFEELVLEYKYHV